jgi:Txe/YoeB family toxin of Txe-Axe toxin-antitoxin module
MKKVAFEGNAFQDFTEWATADKKIYKRIVDLDEAVTIISCKYHYA